MEKDFRVELRQGYIHALLPPEFDVTLPNMSRLSSAIIATCEKHSCTWVLCEGINPKRQMNTSDAYQSAVAISSGKLGLRIACHWINYQTDNLTEFFKAVSRNKGVTVEFFFSRTDALTWLGLHGANLKLGELDSMILE